jgi:hypothetical protein
MAAGLRNVDENLTRAVAGGLGLPEQEQADTELVAPLSAASRPATAAACPRITRSTAGRRCSVTPS